MQNLLRNRTSQVVIHYLKGVMLIVAIFVTSSLYAQAPDEMYLSGTAFLMKGDYGKAVDNLSLAISRDNADELLFIKRGSAYLELNETGKAIEDFDEANLINPQVADLWLAKAYALAGNKDKAVEFLISHLNSPFRLAADSIKKDPFFNSIQDSPEWYGIWQKEWYTDAEKTIADAEFYGKKKRFDEALSVLDAEIVKDPTNADLYLSRGKIFLKQENYAAAAGDFTTSINADKTQIRINILRGSAYLKAGKFKEAIADYTKAIRNDPADFRLYVERAAAYAGQMSWSAAIKDLQVYLKYFEDDLKIVYQCGEYYFAAEDYMNALKSFNRTLKEDPNNALYFKARGKTYEKTAMYRYAINDLSMSLDLDPSDAETWMYHGLAVIHNGDSQSGCSSLQKAKSMGSTEAVKYILENCQ